MDDKISVIVPVYNVEKWLEECVESIVNQTYKNLEIILVDDGSIDKSSEICDDWKIRDSRIKVIHKKNGGLSSARNAGLDICTGEYIAFIDGDDYIKDNMFECLINIAEENNVDVVKCKMYLYYDETNTTKINPLKANKYYDKEELLKCFYYHKDNIAGGMCDKLFKKYLFDSIRFPEGLNTEDYFVLSEIYNNIDGLYSVKDVLYCYRQREDSICRKKYIDNHSFDEIKVCDMIMKKNKKKYPEQLEDSIIMCAIARFSVYNQLINIEHDKSIECEWKNELKRFSKHIRKNSNISFIFKIKYYLFSNFMNFYKRIKNIFGGIK